MKYRVFGSSDVEPEVAELGKNLGFRIGRTRRDEQGWFSTELLLDDELTVRVERYLATEPGVRNELNTWTAWLETVPESTARDLLHDRIVCTRQVLTFEVEGDETEEETNRICTALCRRVAVATAGVYQVDGQGFFDEAGTRLLPETSL